MDDDNLLSKNRLPIVVKTVAAVATHAIDILSLTNMINVITTSDYSQLGITLPNSLVKRLNMDSRVGCHLPRNTFIRPVIIGMHCNIRSKVLLEIKLLKIMV
jgi:hypothetical protein